MSSAFARIERWVGRTPKSTTCSKRRCMPSMPPHFQCQQSRGTFRHRYLPTVVADKVHLTADHLQLMQVRDESRGRYTPSPC